MRYTYYDGAGNKYRISAQQISYTPIFVEESSSGVYDGGSPFVKALDKRDLLSLIDAFERAIWNVEDHQEKREMGTGLIIKTVNVSDHVKIILQRRSDSNLEINKLLRSI